MTQNNIIHFSDISKSGKIEDIKSLSEGFLPTKAFKTKITIDELYKIIQEFKQLARAIKSYEIKGYPEETSDNYDVLELLKDEAEDGESEVQEVLVSLKEDLLKRFFRCERRKKFEDEFEAEEHERNVMSCASHCNPIDTKFN